MIVKPNYVGLTGKVECIWCTPAEGITLDELIDEMIEIGNKVIKIDRKNNRLGMAVNKNIKTWLLMQIVKLRVKLKRKRVS